MLLTTAQQKDSEINLQYGIPPNPPSTPLIPPQSSTGFAGVWSQTKNMDKLKPDGGARLKVWEHQTLFKFILWGP